MVWHAVQFFRPLRDGRIEIFFFLFVPVVLAHKNPFLIKLFCSRLSPKQSEA
jgi:hypothetical protein